MQRPLTFEELTKVGVLEIGDGYRAKNSELGTGGPIFLRSAYLQDSGFVLNNPERFAAGNYRFGRKVAAIDDVVITTKGNSTGRVGRIRRAEAGAVYSPHLSYWRSCDPTRLDQRFLYYWSQGEAFRVQLSGMSTSTDMAPYLSLRDQLRVRIDLPPIAQQVRVGMVLSALDDKIELNRRTNETLEAMAQAIFRDWFIDFGPTHRKCAGITDPIAIMGGVTQDAAKAAELAALFPERLSENGLPFEWSLGRAEDLVEFNPSESLKKGVAAPYSDMSSLPTSGSIADLPVKREFGSGMRFRNGDTLLARITPCLENGKTAFVDFLPDAATIGWGSTEFIVLRGRSGTPPPLGYLLARSDDFRSHAIQSMTGTSGRQRARTESLASWPLPTPPQAVLNAFGELVNCHFAKISLNGAENRTLAETRDYLLPRLMSGAVQVAPLGPDGRAL